jgi:hypothetical protein
MDRERGACVDAATILRQGVAGGHDTVEVQHDQGGSMRPRIDSTEETIRLRPR